MPTIYPYSPNQSVTCTNSPPSPHPLSQAEQEEAQRQRREDAAKRMEDQILHKAVKIKTAANNLYRLKQCVSGYAGMRSFIPACINSLLRLGASVHMHAEARC